VGTFLGWALATAWTSSALGMFSARPARLLIFPIAAGIAAILTGIRAARLDALTALSVT
jgi:hypothetical protein